jgi:hypothetical protein
MKLVTPEQLKPNTLYYIQSPRISGNGKQKGVFANLHESYPGILWATFSKVENINGKFDSGYAIGKRIFRCNLCTFYLPERDIIIERDLVNGALRAITGDPCFEFYEKSKKPIGS